LLDEPLSNLDAKLRDDMREEIRRIQREVGITAVFVTHDQSEAFVLADRVAVMDRGRLQQIADPVSIYEKPANATVGNFIGQANVWTGTVDAVNGERVCVKLYGGTEIVATGANLAPGQVCKIFVKHERIALTHAQSGAADNCFAGRISARTYLGDSTSYTVTLTGDLSLKSVVPNRAGFEHFDIGDDVFASWAAASQVFPA
jgi:ABC-type Fe3+/spermidine/putrescine transport system ATPase subunit